MIDHATLVLKDTLAPRFASIQSILYPRLYGQLRGNSG